MKDFISKYRFNIMSVFFVLSVMNNLFLAGVVDGLGNTMDSAYSKIVSLEKELAEYKKDLILASRSNLKSVVTESELNGYNTDALSDFMEEKVYQHIKKRNPRLEDSYAFETSLAIVEASKKYNISIKILLGMAEVESFYKPNALSPVGAKGVLQIRPKYWVKEIDFIETAEDLDNITKNINAGAYILRDYLDDWNNNINMALLSYNRGITKVKRLVASNINPDNKYPDKVFKRKSKMVI